MQISYVVLLGLLLIAVYTDMTWTRISNRLIVLGLFIGLILRIVGEGSIGILVFIVNISIPVILLYLLFQMRALGAGDIKLFSMIGGFISTEELLQILGVAFFVGAIYGLGKIAYQNLYLKRVYKKTTQIHFSPAIVVAYLMVIWR